MGEDLSRLILLLLFAAAFVNITRGSFRDWLGAKFIGHPGPAVAAAASGPAGSITLQPVRAPASVGASKVGAVVTQRPKPGADQQGRGGHISLADFARGFHVSGLSAQQVAAIAFRQAPSYGGVRYVPHNIAQEGQIQTKNGRRFIRVKFTDPTGRGSNSTEDVFLP